MGFDRNSRCFAGGLCLMVVSAIGLSRHAAAQPRFEGPPLVCVSSAETRDLFVANKLIQPFRVMREAGRATRADAIDIQLCRLQGALVYDVTLLGPEGRIIHRLFSATNGTVVNGRPMAVPGRAESPEGPPPRSGFAGPPEGLPPRPGFMGPREGLPPRPGFMGPREGFPPRPGFAGPPEGLPPRPGFMGPPGRFLPRPGFIGPPGRFPGRPGFMGPSFLPRPGERRPGAGE